MGSIIQAQWDVSPLDSQKGTEEQGQFLALIIEVLRQTPGVLFQY